MSKPLSITVLDFWSKGYQYKVFSGQCVVEDYFTVRGGTVSRVVPKETSAKNGIETFNVHLSNGESVILSYDYTLSVQWLEEAQP